MEKSPAVSLPLAFRAGEPWPLPEEQRPAEENDVVVRTVVRSLEGMQKEAIVTCAPPGVTWRLLSDEGPYLNGTDLAPFPLAFFTAGMQFSLMSQMIRQLSERSMFVKALSVSQQNQYSMNGSFLRGDALGGAMPANIRVCMDGHADPDLVSELVRQAARSCPAQALMRDPLENAFALRVNGRSVPLEGLRSCAGPVADFFPDRFPTPEPSEVPPQAIVSKVREAEKVWGVEGGAGTSLAPEQKRTLDVRGEARMAEGLLLETTTDLVRPLGSSFRFLCDAAAGGKGTAPPALVYLAAGIGFCYMTQLGRYAQIVHEELDSYRIVQDSLFTPGDALKAGRVQPPNTWVFMDGNVSPEAAAKLVAMGERTCFLHAAMRGTYPSRITAELNGAELLF